MKCNIKTLRKYYNKWDSLNIGGPTYLWPFTSRLPHYDIKLIGEFKGLVHDFWHENTRPSSNQNDVLKLRRGSRDLEPYIKHFLDITYTQLYERFKTIHNELNLSQISFHKCKPWYVRINIICNTCCRYHIEYGYYHDTHIPTLIKCIHVSDE